MPQGLVRGQVGAAVSSSVMMIKTGRQRAGRGT
jgi:hypothetical protein